VGRVSVVLVASDDDCVWVGVDELGDAQVFVPPMSVVPYSHVLLILAK